MNITNFEGALLPGGYGNFGLKYKPQGAGNLSRVWFVDGISGSDANEGFDPERAFATVGKAVSKAGAYDVIYILDKGYDISSGDPTPYRETATAGNLVVTYGKSNLAIIGVPHNIRDLFGLQIKAALTLTTPILSVYAPLVAIENLDFNGTGDDLARGNIYFYSNDATHAAENCSVCNCHIRNGKGSAGVASQGGGVVIQGGWYHSITGNRFENCRCGIYIVSAAGTVKGTRIERNVFTGDITLIDCDIYMNTGGSNIVTQTSICGNYFAHDVGSYGYKKYVSVKGDGGLLGNYFAHLAVEAKAAGADIIIPTTFRMAGNFDEAGIILRTA
jgi:hypothetical protein